MEITKTYSIEDFEPWSGAVATFEKIWNAHKLKELENYIENELGYATIDERKLNDILWFDADAVLSYLGLNDEDEDNDENNDEEEEEEEEEKPDLPTDVKIQIDKADIEYMKGLLGDNLSADQEKQLVDDLVVEALSSKYCFCINGVDEITVDENGLATCKGVDWDCTD